MKNLKKLINILTLSTLTLTISGCNQSATSVLEKDPIFGQNMQYTKVGKIIKNNDVKALINITYLNSVDSKTWDNGKQNFLVGTYIAEDTNTNYTLTLNEFSPISIDKVPKDNKTFQNIALHNKWAKYTITTFDDVEDKKLTLVYRNNIDNNATIVFTKE